MAPIIGKFAAAAAALAVMSTPTAAIASAAPAAISAPAAQSAAGAWSTLSVMTSASSASSASLAAAQYDARDERRGVGGIPLPVIGVFLLTLGVFIWILTQDDDEDEGFDIPNSPT